MTFSERLTGLPLRENIPIALVGLGHGAIHWTAATFYLLLPPLSMSLGLSYTEAGALVSVFHVSSFVSNFFSGPLVDITGRKVLFQILSVAIGATALAAIGLAGTLLTLAGLVAVIGVTGNAWHPPAISFLSNRYPKNRGYALSIHGLGASTGDTIAPLAAGALIAGFGWHKAAELSALPVLAVAAILAVGLLRYETVRPKTGAAHGIGVAEYFQGIRTVIANRAILGLCVMSGFRSMTQSGLLAFLPLYLAHDMGSGPVMIGIAMAAMQVGGVIATPVAGVWSDRAGRRTVVLAGLSASTVIIASLTFLGSETAFIAGISLLGFVLYAVRPVVHSWMMDLTPDHLGGSATSLMFGTQSGFSMAMPLVGGMLADAYGLVSIFYMLAGTILVTNILTLGLPNEQPETSA
jgi:MFS transporter, FSR family, fosmidomycin resistance protein